MADINTVKRKIGQLVVTCPRYLKMTIPALEREYREETKHYIPYKKFGHLGLLSFLRSIDDVIKLESDSETGGLYLSYVMGFSETMDNYRKVILKDKIPSDYKKRQIKMKRELLAYSDQPDEFLPMGLYKSPQAPQTPRLPPTKHFYDRVIALIDGRKEVWSYSLFGLYTEAHGLELPLKMYGYGDVSDLVDDLERQKLIRVERSKLSKNHRLLPYTMPPPSLADIEKDFQMMFTQIEFCVPVGKIFTLYREIFQGRDLFLVFPSITDLTNFLTTHGFNLLETADFGLLAFAKSDPQAAPCATKAPEEKYLELPSEGHVNNDARLVTIHSLEDTRLMWLDDYDKYEVARDDLGDHLRELRSRGCFDLTPRTLKKGQPLAVRGTGNGSLGKWERAVVLNVTRSAMDCSLIDIGREVHLKFPLKPSFIQLLPEKFASEPVYSRRVTMQLLPPLLKQYPQRAAEMMKEIIGPSRLVTVWPAGGINPRLDNMSTLVGYTVDEALGLPLSLRSMVNVKLSKELGVDL